MSQESRANAASLVGNVLCGRYELLKIIGAGGMGAVYQARHIHLNTIRAIKILLSHHGSDPHHVTRFLREARGLAALSHPNVVSVVDTGETEQGLPFIAMEYLEGEPLSATLKQDGPLPWPVVKHIAGQVCRALHAAHQHGIIHRDVKPANCFRVFDEHDGYRVKLLDFGIAKFQHDEGSSLTDAGSVLGTLPYMSYEQVCGQKCDAQSDIWSAAVMFYRLLTGVLPFRGESMGQISLAIMQKEPLSVSRVRPNLDIPTALGPVLAQAMAKERAQRFATMTSFLEALESVADSPSGFQTTPFTTPRKPASPPLDTPSLAYSTDPTSIPRVGTQPLKRESVSQSLALTPTQTSLLEGIATSSARDPEALSKEHPTLDSQSPAPSEKSQQKRLVLLLTTGPLVVVCLLLLWWSTCQSWNTKEPSPKQSQTQIDTPSQKRPLVADAKDEARVRAVDDRTIAATSSGGDLTRTSSEILTEGHDSETGPPPSNVEPANKTVADESSQREPKQPSKPLKKAQKKNPVLTCASLGKKRGVRTCIRTCQDCIHPVKVRVRAGNLVVLGTNKSAISLRGKSLSTCLHRATENVDGLSAVGQTCELSNK